MAILDALLGGGSFDFVALLFALLLAIFEALLGFSF